MFLKKEIHKFYNFTAKLSPFGVGDVSNLTIVCNLTDVTYQIRLRLNQ